jgi:hypothetical protein
MSKAWHGVSRLTPKAKAAKPLFILCLCLSFVQWVPACGQRGDFYIKSERHPWTPKGYPGHPKSFFDTLTLDKLPEVKKWALGDKDLKRSFWQKWAMTPLKEVVFYKESI